TTVRGLTLGIPAGVGGVACLVRCPNVLPGAYRLEVWISEVPGTSFADHLRMIGGVEIVPSPVEGVNLSALTLRGRGHVFMECEWQPRTAAPSAREAS